MRRQSKLKSRCVTYNAILVLGNNMVHLRILVCIVDTADVRMVQRLLQLDLRRVASPIVEV